MWETFITGMVQVFGNIDNGQIYSALEGGKAGQWVFSRRDDILVRNLKISESFPGEKWGERGQNVMGISISTSIED